MSRPGHRLEPMQHSNHSRPKNLEMHFKSTPGTQHNTFTEHFDGCKLNYRSRKTNMLLGNLAPNVVTRICPRRAGAASDSASCGQRSVCDITSSAGAAETGATASCATTTAYQLNSQHHHTTSCKSFRHQQSCSPKAPRGAEEQPTKMVRSQTHDVSPFFLSCF